MHIYIDESGSFTRRTGHENRWSVVGALVASERQNIELHRVVERWKSKLGVDELKCRIVRRNEARWREIVKEITATGVCINVEAVNMSASDGLEDDRENYARKYERSIPVMNTAKGRDGLQRMADEVRNISTQEYTQLRLMCVLIPSVAIESINYYVMREKDTIGKWHWRLDRKDGVISRRLWKFAQDYVLSKVGTEEYKLPRMEGEDYSALDKITEPPDKNMEYLNTTYGVGVDVNNLRNLGRVFTNDAKWVDSRKENGVQAADIVIGGTRAALQGDMDEPVRAARLLGRMTIQKVGNGPAIGMNIRPKGVDPQLGIERVAMDVLTAMTAGARPMIPKNRRRARTE